MKVNGIDVKETYGVEQWNVVQAFSTLKNESEWPEGNIQPMMQQSTIGFKKISASIVIRGSNRDDIWKKSAEFISKLIKPCEIQFNGFEHYYYMVLTNATQAEQSLQRWHKATLELQGYEHGAELITTSTAKTIVINNQGNLDTPAIIEILPVINLVDITISGAVRNLLTGEEKDIVIKDLLNGQKVVIDGENGLVTQAGVNKFSDVDMWDFPVLKPGMNTITVNKDVELTVRYKPRYF